MQLTREWIREHLVPDGRFTIVIYASTSAVCSGLLLVRNMEMLSPGGSRGWAIFLSWLLLFFPPLVFAYSYPRQLFAASSRNQRLWALFHGLASVGSTIAFPLLALPFWENPIYRMGDSMVAEFAPLLVPAILFIAALFILIKGRSILTPAASVLIWPYWLMLSLLYVGRWFQDSPLNAVLYFFCFLAPILFAFAAGAVRQNGLAALIAALLGIMACPWLYRNVMKDSGLGNVWTAFNAPDRDLGFYFPGAQLSILTVAFVCIAVTLAVLRLLPSRTIWRQSPLRERTWPAFFVCGGVLAIWFSVSVMPYRIPGAVDYADYPILKILHIEKRGLKFHETLVSVSDVRYRNRFGVSKTDRRLFQYRFTVSSASGTVPASLIDRVNDLIQQPKVARPEWGNVKPLRAWNADAWYLYSERTGLKAYTKENGSAPPPEVISLFQDLENSPRHPNAWRSELKDVCLGFCYDPLSAMGWLYANHRCHNDDDGDVVCR